MVARVQSPITGEPTEVIFSRPYDSPSLKPFAARAGVESRLAQKPYEIRFCPTSGLYFQTWVLEDAELGGLYSSGQDDPEYASEIARQKLHYFAHMTEEILVMRQMLAPRRPVALDFGCNWGKWASMALAHGCDVYAVEVNPTAADFCRRRGIKIVTRDELKDLRFDFINVDQVMEHLTDPLGVARLLAGLLQPWGMMKWSTPNNPELPRLLRAAQASGDESVLNPKTIDSLAPLEHVNLFSNESLKFLGRQVGLEPVRLPFWKWMGAGQIWNLPRQLNRNLIVPLKRFRMKGTYLWFKRRA